MWPCRMFFLFFPKYCKVVVDSPADTQWDRSSLVFWSVSRPSAPGQSSFGGAVCKQRKPQLVHIAQAGTHTQPGRPSVVCGPVFFFFPFFHFFFSLCLLLSPLFLSVLAPLGEKRSVLKHVLNITIFTFSCFKQAAEGGSVSVCVVWIFPFCVCVSACVCAEVPAQRSALFETLNLFHAYLFYDFGGHRVYTGSATSGSDNLLGINQVHEPIDHQPLQLCYESFISFHSATFFHNCA